MPISISMMVGKLLLIGIWDSGEKRLLSMGFFLDKGVLAVGRWMYHRLPVSESAGYGLKSFLYERFGFLFKHTVSYRIWRNAQDDVRKLSSLLFDLSGFIRPVDSNEIISFSRSDDPLVSVIMPLFLPADSLLSCLKSLSRACVGCPAEVVMVNPLPAAESHPILSRVAGALVVPVRSDKTMADMWKTGVEMPGGRYLAFLAPGCLPLPGWMDEMVRIFREHPDAGLVGAQIIRPDGKIWESGGEISEDGRLFRMGEGAHPLHPDFSYLREMDFCSALAFMVPADMAGILDKPGGLLKNGGDDPVRFGADFCSGIRSAGRKTYYHPLAKAVVLSGFTDILRKHAAPGSRLDGKITGVEPNGKHRSCRSARTPCGRVLFIDVRTPTPDQDSGSQDMVSYFQIFRSLGFACAFIPGADLQFMEKYTPDLQRMGVHCLYAPFVPGIAGHLESHGRVYDLVLLYKVHCAAFCMDMVRRYCPQAKIIFNTVDLHFVREQRQAEIEGSEDLMKTAEATRLLELSMIQQADRTVVLSTEERAFLLREPGVAADKVAVIPLIREIPGRSRPFSERKNLLFVGGFEHRPNVDAMRYFVRDVWPLIQPTLPEAVFYIIGSKPPQAVRELASENIVITGYLPDISSYFHDSRLSVAPLRYGAGLKGKIATSLSYGLPCVASSIAVEGSDLEPEKDILVADTPESFAEAVLRLYQDEGLWNALSDNGLDFVDRHFSFAAGRQRIENLLRELQVLKG
jgi:glycosyltransferase involved in cell wall biosynthesis